MSLLEANNSACVSRLRLFVAAGFVVGGVVGIVEIVGVTGETNVFLDMRVGAIRGSLVSYHKIKKLMKINKINEKSIIILQNERLLDGISSQ